MPRPSPLHSLVRALALLSAFVLLLVCRTAQAGTLQVRDEAHVLTAQDISRLRSVVAEVPFDARLLVTTAYPDMQGLADRVHGVLNEPDMVAVGLDPQHHHVEVRFGTGSRIPPAAYSSIERAGNDAFRAGDWE